MSSSQRPQPPPTSTVNEVFVETEPGIGTFTYRWPRPGLTADVVLVAEPGVAPESALAAKETTTSTLLLIERKRPPGAGRWALPGGFVNEGEGLESAAQRELKEETGVSAVAVGTEGTQAGGKEVTTTTIAIEQTRSYGDAKRDPRGWTVTVAFAGVARSRHEEHRKAAAATAGSDDAADARWWPLSGLPPMAFDHKVIVRDALSKLLKEEKDEKSEFVRDLKAALDSEALKGDWR